MEMRRFFIKILLFLIILPPNLLGNDADFNKKMLSDDVFGNFKIDHDVSDIDFGQNQITKRYGFKSIIGKDYDENTAFYGKFSFSGFDIESDLNDAELLTESGGASNLIINKNSNARNSSVIGAGVMHKISGNLTIKSEYLIQHDQINREFYNQSNIDGYNDRLNFSLILNF